MLDVLSLSWLEEKAYMDDFEINNVMKITNKWERMQYCRYIHFPLLPDSFSSTISKWIN